MHRLNFLMEKRFKLAAKATLKVRGGIKELLKG